jgi:hypothetical protein
VTESSNPSGALPDYWKKCNECKKSIAYGTIYYVCNVSTCNRKRTGLTFCSVSCWDAHVPMMNHRESWAEEKRAPTRKQWEEILAEEAAPKTRTRATSEGAKKEDAESAASNKTPESGPKVILRRSRSDSSGGAT